MRVVLIDDSHDLAVLAQLSIERTMNDVDLRIVTDNFDQLFLIPFWNGVDMACVDLYLHGSDISGIHILDWMKRNVPGVLRVVVTSLDSDDLDADLVGSELAQRVFHKPVRPDQWPELLRFSLS